MKYLKTIFHSEKDLSSVAINAEGFWLNKYFRGSSRKFDRAFGIDTVYNQFRMSRKIFTLK